MLGLQPHFYTVYASNESFQGSAEFIVTIAKERAICSPYDGLE